MIIRRTVHRIRPIFILIRLKKPDSLFEVSVDFVKVTEDKLRTAFSISSKELS